MSEDKSMLKWQMGDTWYALIAESMRRCQEAARIAYRDPEGKLYDEFFNEIRLFAMTCKNLFGEQDWKEYEVEEDKLKKIMCIDQTGTFSLNLGNSKIKRAEVHNGCFDLLNWLVRRAHKNRLLIPTAYRDPNNPGIGA